MGRTHPECPAPPFCSPGDRSGSWATMAFFSVSPHVKNSTECTLISRHPTTMHRSRSAWAQDPWSSPHGRRQAPESPLPREPRAGGQWAVSVLAALRTRRAGPQCQLTPVSFATFLRVNVANPLVLIFIHKSLFRDCCDIPILLMRKPFLERVTQARSPGLANKEARTRLVLSAEVLCLQPDADPPPS